MKPALTRVVRTLASVSALALSLTAQAGQSQEIYWDASQNSFVAHMDDVESHPVYRYEEVPDTCYKTVVSGSHEECHTEYDRSCTPTTRQECNYENHPTCTTEWRNVCQPTTVCEDHTEEVCKIRPNGTRDCVPVTARRCHNSQVCNNVPERVCSDHSVRVCHDVSDQVCTDIPRQECQTVSDYESVPYSCTKTERVFDHDEIDFNVSIDAKVDFILRGLAEQSPAETFSLDSGDDATSLSLENQSKRYVMFMDQKNDVQVTGDKQKQITSEFVVTAIPTSDFTAALQGKISNLRFVGKEIQFELAGQVTPEMLKTSLMLKRLSDFLVSDRVLFEGQIPAPALRIEAIESNGVKQSRVTIDTSELTLASPIQHKKYQLELKLELNRDALKGALNSEAVPQGLKLETAQQLNRN